MNPEILRRPLHPETRVIDDKAGIVEYIASDETIDSFGELIRSKGWRFTHFAKNAPFVDSHRYDSVEDLLGKVIDFEVKRGRLVETVQWAIDVPDNRLAKLGFDMTAAGYARAVSVGFWPVKIVSKWDSDPSAYRKELERLELSEEDGPRTIYLEQEQIELSAVIVGANPNALALAKRACVLTDDDIDYIQRRNGTGPSNLPRTSPTPRQAARNALPFYLCVNDLTRKH